MSTKVLNIPRLVEPEAQKMARGARTAFAGHPMDDFMSRTFQELKHRREKSAFIRPLKKNAPVSR